MTIISGTADHRFPIFVSNFIIVVWNMPKYPHLFPSLDQAIFWNLMLRLLQMVFLGSIFQKFSGDPHRMSHAFGARLHDHSHDASFATGPAIMHACVFFSSLNFQWSLKIALLVSKLQRFVMLISIIFRGTNCELGPIHIPSLGEYSTGYSGFR
jgi:hypothetical protein